MWLLPLDCDWSLVLPKLAHNATQELAAVLNSIKHQNCDQSVAHQHQQKQQALYAVKRDKLNDCNDQVSDKYRKEMCVTYVTYVTYVALHI